MISSKESRFLLSAVLWFFLCFPLQGQEQGLQFLNHPDYIAGKGYGESPAVVRQAALGELSRYFVSQVTTETREFVEMKDSESSSRLSQETFVSSQTDLFSVRYGEPHYLEGQSLWECVAYINRQEAWGVYKQRLDPLVQTFARLCQSAREESDPLSCLLFYSRALSLAQKNELSSKQAFATALYPAGAAEFAPLLEELGALEAKISILANQCPVYVECSQDFNNMILTATTETLSRQGFVVTNDRTCTEYVCIVTVTENFQELSGGNFYTPQVQIALACGNKSLYAQSFSIQRTGARNGSVAKQRCYKAIADELRKSFLEE